MAASIANAAVDFAYVLEGGLPLINFPNTVYFVAEEGAVYVGNTCIANNVRPEDIVRVMDEAGYKIRSFSVQGSGNVVTDIQVDGEGHITATKGNLDTSVYLGSDSTISEEPSFGGTFQVLQNIGIANDGHGIIRKFVNVKLPSFSINGQSGEIEIQDTNTWYKLNGLAVTQNINKTLSIAVDIVDQDGRSSTQTFTSQELDLVTSSELAAVRTLAQTAKDTADAAKAAADSAKSVADTAKAKADAAQDNIDEINAKGYQTEAQVKSIVDTEISKINAEGGSAKTWIGESQTSISDGGKELPAIPGYAYASTSELKAGNVVGYGDDEFIWTGDHWRKYGNMTDAVLKTQQVIAGTGMSGGGALSGNVTLNHQSGTKSDVTATGLEAITKVVTDDMGHVTQVEKTDLENAIKDVVGDVQSPLEAGTGIKIENGVISSTVDTYTKSEIDGMIDAATGTDMSAYARMTDVNAAIANKQDTLTPGDNITIQNNTISADLSSVEDDIDDLKSDVAGVKSDVTSLQTDVSGVKSSVSTLETDMASVKSSVEDMEDTVKEIEAAASAAQGKLKAGTGISITKDGDETVIAVDNTVAAASDLSNLATSIQNNYSTTAQMNSAIATAKQEAIAAAEEAAGDDLESVVDDKLDDYYTKSEIYTKSEVDALVTLPVASDTEVNDMFEEVFQ